MEKTIKIISELDLSNRIITYKKYEEYLLDLVIQSFGYYNKFETGHGWLLNANKLTNSEYITDDLHSKILSWFNQEFKLDQKIIIENWREYQANENLIEFNLKNLIR